jgi:hypothetical protein
MHYIKGSLFKSQIFGGTRDELTDQLKKWFLFADRRGRDFVRERGVSGEQLTNEAMTGGERGVCLFVECCLLFYFNSFVMHYMNEHYSTVCFT